MGLLSVRLGVCYHLNTPRFHHRRMVMIAGLSLLHQYVALCLVGLLAVLLHITAIKAH